MLIKEDLGKSIVNVGKFELLYNKSIVDLFYKGIGVIRFYYGDNYLSLVIKKPKLFN